MNHNPIDVINILPDIIFDTITNKMGFIKGIGT
jgi:hypothetical protein